MKRILGLGMAVVALALGASALAQTFTAGNLVVYRIGDGSSQLTNIGSVVFLDEYTTAGSLVQSIMLRTNFFGANTPLIANATASGEGLLTRSTDRRFLVLTGYGTRLGGGSSALSGISASTVPRVVGLVDGFGHIDTTTVQTNSLSNGENPRSATSDNGTNIWYAGDAGGIRYTTRGATAATQLSTFVNNMRQINIFSNGLNNALYMSDASGASIRIGVVTNGLPTTTNGVFYANLSGFQSNNGSPYAFVLLNVAGGASNDTLYVADEPGTAAGAVAGIYKWSLVGGTWTSNGFITASNARGITGKAAGGVVNLYITTAPAASTSAPYTGGGFLLGYTDSAGSGNPPTSQGSDIGDIADFAVAPDANKVFRGVAFAPVGGESFPSDVGRISVGPVLGFTYSGLTGGPFGTKDYSVANPGTSSVAWAVSADAGYLSFSTTSGTLTSGGSITVTVSFNGSANSLTAGTNTALVTFTNVTSVLGTTTRPVTLIIADQSVTPSTDYSISGPPGGPWAPLSKVYTITNGFGPGTISWTVDKSQTWLDLSATSGSLAGGAATNITVSVNTNNANALAAGNYSDVVSFSNATAGTLIDTRAVNLASGFVYFCDDFSTFSDGNLVGQQNWKRHTSSGSVSTLPIQISGGKLVIPDGQIADNEDAYKDTVLSTNEVNVYLGVSITVSNVPTLSTSYMMAIIGKNGGTLTANSFANYRLSCTNDGSGFFAFNARTTGQAQDPSTSGAHIFTTGTKYRVIVMTDRNGTNMTVFVNPTSAADTNSPYLVHVMGAGASAATGVGGVLISQFASASIHNVAYALDQLCISTNLAEVLNSLGGAAPADPFATWQQFYFGSTNSANSLAGADPDHDGMSNTNEFLAGFNPTNNAAYLHVISAVKTNNDIKVTYLGASGDSNGSAGPKTNVLDVSLGGVGVYTGNNYSNNWVSANQTNVLSGGSGLGTVTNFVDPSGATGLTRYYRVRVLLP